MRRFPQPPCLVVPFRTRHSVFAKAGLNPQNPFEMERTKRPARTSWARARRKVQASLDQGHKQLLSLVCRLDEPTYSVIASDMGLKLHELHTLRKWMFKEFDIRSKVGLVLFAYRWGIVPVK